MKKDTIRVSLEAEKLRAIKRYMEKKDIDIQDELTEQLQKLYEKHVPANVREYIDEKNEEESRAKTSRRTAKNTGTTASASNPQE